MQTVSRFFISANRVRLNGLFIRHILAKRKLRQHNLAGEFRVKSACVSKWLSGQTRFPTEKLNQLSEFLSVPPGALILSGRGAS